MEYYSFIKTHHVLILQKDSLILSEKENKDCASVSSGAGGRGSTFQAEVQQHQAEPVDGISCEVEIPGDHLTFPLSFTLPSHAHHWSLQAWFISTF